MKAIKKPKKLGRPKLRPYKNIRKQAWDLQSEWVRRSAKGVCFTCEDTREWKLQQAGHFIHKNCLDFDLRNIHCQCVKCNKYLSGNLVPYTIGMIEKYGKEVVDYLRRNSYQVKKFSRSELETMIEDYKAMLKVLDLENG